MTVLFLSQIGHTSTLHSGLLFVEGMSLSAELYSHFLNHHAILGSQHRKQVTCMHICVFN